MADKLGLGTEVRELKLGPSFTNNKSTSFHTLRYDFKPASVDLNKVATVDVGSGNQVTVTVPHLDGAGTSHTVFKGSQRPYQKECVLIIDRTTGEITLEKLTHNIQVKKTRMEVIQQKLTPPLPCPNTRTAFDMPTNVQEKLSVPPSRPKNKKKTSPKSHQPPASLSGCIPRHSPLHASPPYPTHSPTRPQHKSPPQNNPRNNPMPASLPMIGMDDVSDIGFGNVNRFGGSQPQQQQDVSRPPRHSPEYESNGAEEVQEEIGILPDSSSSDSSSDSGSSDSDSEPDIKPTTYNTSSINNVNGHMNGTASPSLSMPDHLLKEDLQLSESGSESD